MPNISSAGAGAPGGRKKVSPVVYVAAFSVVAFLVVQFTTPPVPTASPKAPVRTTAASAGAATADDTDAPDPDADVHFPRYAGGTRDPFAAVVVPTSPHPVQVAAVVRPAQQWNLTGITDIDGVSSALLENSKTGDTVFLRRGDHWNGTQVAGISDQAVTLVDSRGDRTSVGFVDPSVSSQGGAPAEGGGRPQIPSLSSIGPLPPLSSSTTVQPLTVTPSFPGGTNNNESPDQ
jgi:hypothetical protein